MDTKRFIVPDKNGTFGLRNRLGLISGSPPATLSSTPLTSVSSPSSQGVSQKHITQSDPRRPTHASDPGQP